MPFEKLAFHFHDAMSYYRNLVWFYRGCRDYTKGGYLSAAKKFGDSDLEVDCSGKSYMITGANSGIGKQVREKRDISNN